MQNYRGQLHNLHTSTREDGTAAGLTGTTLSRFTLSDNVSDVENILAHSAC